MRLLFENVGGSTIATSQRRPLWRASASNSRTSSCSISPRTPLSARFAAAQSRYVRDRSTLVVSLPATAAYTLNAPVYANRFSIRVPGSAATRARVMR